MSRDEALAKLIAIRHYCFVRGILGSRSSTWAGDIPPQDDFRQAYRTTNRLYARLGDRVEGQSDATHAKLARRRRAA
jgi:hypothetical protein